MIEHDVSDEACIVPLLDTWRVCDRGGSWTWRLEARDPAALLADMFEALRPLARVREAVLGTAPDTPPLDVPAQTWLDGTPHARFERELLEAVRVAGRSVTFVELTFDLRVWVRTAASPAVPVHGWIEGAAWGGLDAGATHPYGHLLVHHTLFIDGDLTGDPNTELHRLNQPLLRDALAAIEARLGPIIEVEGFPGVTRTGFAPADVP